MSDTPPIGGAADTAPAPAPVDFDFSSEDSFRSFVSTLSPEQQGSQILKETKTFGSFVDQALNAQEFIKKSGKIDGPSNDWTQDQLREWQTGLKLAPEDASGYEFPKDLSVTLEEGADPRSYAFEEQTTEALANAAHRMGLQPWQAQEMAQIWAEQELAGADALTSGNKEIITAGLNGLREEWGDDFDLNHRSANEAFATLAERIPELNDLVGLSEVVQNHPGVLKLFAELAPLVHEAGMNPGTGRVGSGFQGETVAQIQSEMQAFLDSPEGQLINQDPMELNLSDRERRERAIAKRMEFFKKLHSDSE